jgi:hypothetical protein
VPCAHLSRSERGTRAFPPKKCPTEGRTHTAQRAAPKEHASAVSRRQTAAVAAADRSLAARALARRRWVRPGLPAAGLTDTSTVPEGLASGGGPVAAG